jgi:hypothetical protein
MGGILKLLKAMVPTPDGLCVVDAVETDDGVWLIPSWLDNCPSKGFSKPAYMIRIHAQKTRFGECDYLLNTPLPKCVFEGKSTKEFEKLYEIRHLPDLFFDTPDGEKQSFQS